MTRIEHSSDKALVIEAFDFPVGSHLSVNGVEYVPKKDMSVEIAKATRDHYLRIVGHNIPRSEGIITYRNPKYYPDHPGHIPKPVLGRMVRQVSISDVDRYLGIELTPAEYLGVRDEFCLDDQRKLLARVRENRVFVGLELGCINEIEAEMKKPIEEDLSFETWREEDGTEFEGVLQDQKDRILAVEYARWLCMKLGLQLFITSHGLLFEGTDRSEEKRKFWRLIGADRIAILESLFGGGWG